MLALGLPVLSAASEVRLAQLTTLIEAGQPRRAAPPLRAMLATNPDDHHARATLGRALSAMNRCDEALEHLLTAFPTEGWSARAAASEGDCHWQQGDLEWARAAYEEAIWMNPQLVPARFDLARMLIQLGDYDAVRVQIEELDQQVGDTHRARILEVMLAMATDEDAWPVLEQLQQEVEEDPGVGGAVTVHYLEGWLWMQLGDPDMAERSFGQAVGTLGSHEDSILSRAEALRRSGRLDGARQVAWRRVLKTSVLLHPVRARILVDEGRLAEARAELALCPDPNHPEALASAWYIATAAGEDADPLREAWSWTPKLQTKDLAHLHPLEAP